MLIQGREGGNMNKYIKTIIYVLVAYIIICVINSLLFSIEFILGMAPEVIYFPKDWDIDVAIWILVGINFVISVFTYIHVGVKFPKTNNTCFDTLIILLPFVLSNVCLIIMNYNVYLECMGWVLNSSLGMLTMALDDSPIKYAIALFPSVCIFIGYVYYKINNRSTKPFV